MAEIWCVRANYGQYADRFKEGGFAAIGWFDNVDLSVIPNREGIEAIYQAHHPHDTSPYAIGQQVGQVSRFLFEIKVGDFVMTPTSNPDRVLWGTVADVPYKHVGAPADGCPYQHRRRVDWNGTPVFRSTFSVPLQNTMRSSLTVFWVRQKDSFFEAIGRKDLVPAESRVKETTTELVLRRVLELDDKEFELLVTELLRSLGFEAEHVGKVGDGGVDATGEMNIYNVARIKLYVQAKRFKPGTKISPSVVRALRQNISAGAQGAFITTADFQTRALLVATEPLFPRIGTVNGNQLVDLLTEKWDDLPEEFRQKLGLKRGLVAE